MSKIPRREFLKASGAMGVGLVVWPMMSPLAQAGDRPLLPNVPSYFSAGGVLIVSSSHQDTAWMGTPAFCRNYRIKRVIMPALDLMQKDANYTFSIENTLDLMEFLEAHPERRGEVIRRMKEGRFEVGAAYNEPYESWLSGEELVREIYFGRRWIKKNLPGCDAKVYFNPDPPERTLQMQQILAKAGVPYMFISRFKEGLYRWQSPDGSDVLAYTPGTYFAAKFEYLYDNPESCVRNILAKLNEVQPYYEQRRIPPVYCFFYTSDFNRPKDFSPLIRTWNSSVVVSGGVPWPSLSYSSSRRFFRDIDKPQARFDTLIGERPDVWAYITGPTHHRLASVKREAARLLPAAEIFTTFAGLLNGNLNDWPTDQLNQAWMNELYPDHGLGGKDGHITDEIYYRKCRRARDTGRAVLCKALEAIADQVKTDVNKGVPVIVFNDLSWQRSDTVEMNLPESFASLVRVTDAHGKEIPSQFTTVGQPDEIDVAAAAMGARATASSTFSSDYSACNAINGKWAVNDPYPALGGADRWKSANCGGPHWLKVDFGQPRSIHKVTIRHQGVLGIYGEATRFNTANFQIQGAESSAGPWTNLVASVVGNTLSLTSYTFAPKTVRFLRLFITRGTQPDGDQLARIFEVQAFAHRPAKAKLIFVATDVPPLGYKTFYLAGAAETKMSPQTSVGEGVCENDFYRVTLASGGIKSIFDKAQQRELLNTDKFLGGEVFTMLSVTTNQHIRALGTDAGEFGVMPLPVMDQSFDHVAAHKPHWKLIENGLVRSVYQLEQALAETSVVQRVLVWHPIKRIDCEIDLKDFDGKFWREFRMALPLALNKPNLAYEVPMGVVEIGKDEIPIRGGRASDSLDYCQPCRDIHPRLVQNFVDASDKRGGLTMSSSVSVFDWIDPTTTKVPSNELIQPVLLASRKSCNSQGVWYPQAGDHAYRFSLCTHDHGWRHGWREGIGANHPFHLVVGAMPRSDARLPEAKTFFSVSEPNVAISTIKKCEDDNSVIVRMFDIEGRNSKPLLAAFLPVRDAKHANVIEEPGDKIRSNGQAVRLSISHHSIETVKLNLLPPDRIN